MAGACAINNERQADKESAKEKKKLGDAAKAAKKKADSAKLSTKRAELMPGMEEDIAKGWDHVQGLNNTRLKELLQFYYNKKKMGTKNKADLLKEVWEAMNPEQPQEPPAP